MNWRTKATLFPVISSFQMAVLFSWAAAAADDLSPALQAYKAKDYQKAAKILQDLIGHDPYNAQAHYYLANSYVFLKEGDKAMKEYSTCFDLEPLSQAGQSSRQALLSFGKKFRGFKSGKDGKVDDGTSVKQAVTSIHTQTCEVEKLHQQRASSQAARAAVNGELRNARLNKAAEQLLEDLKAQPQANSPQIQEEMHEIKQRAAFEGQKALHDAHEQAAKHMSDALKKAANLENSASSLMSLISEKQRPGKVKLKAAGTSLYARNYSFEALPPPEPLSAEALLLPPLGKGPESSTCSKAASSTCKTKTSNSLMPAVRSQAAATAASAASASDSFVIKKAGTLPYPEDKSTNNAKSSMLEFILPSSGAPIAELDRVGILHVPRNSKD